MSQEFQIEIISPDKIIFKGSSKETVLPCFEGQVTILKDHIPFITFLRPGIIEVENGEKFYVEEGTIEFSDNKLLILSATTKNLKDMKNISEMIKKTEEGLSDDKLSDKQKYILNYKIETLKQLN
tara:strand:+ start:868 stop:1242 length:375 start_codon:yes stop_codon:yes gene_type:complete